MWFSATLSTKMNDGPFWRKTQEAEKYFCRKNFWKNLLFINNYISVDEPVSDSITSKKFLSFDFCLQCVQQSWYLASDFQLFIIGILLLTTFVKYELFIHNISLFPITAHSFSYFLIYNFLPYDFFYKQNKQNYFSISKNSFVILFLIIDLNQPEKP